MGTPAVKNKYYMSLEQVIGTLFTFNYIPIFEQLQVLISLSGVNKKFRNELNNNLYWRDFYEGYFGLLKKHAKMNRELFFKRVFDNEQTSRLSNPTMYCVIGWVIDHENSSWTDYRFITETKVFGLFAKRRRALRVRQLASTWANKQYFMSRRNEYCGATIIKVKLRSPTHFPLRGRKRFANIFISTASIGCSEIVDPDRGRVSSDESEGSLETDEALAKRWDCRVRPILTPCSNYVLQDVNDSSRPLQIPVLARDGTTRCGGTYDEHVYWVKVGFRY